MVGRFYDAGGVALPGASLEERIAAMGEEIPDKYPPCNMRWSQKVGSPAPARR